VCYGFEGRAAAPNYVAVAVGVLCCVALMLPTEGDKPPAPFHLSVNVKLVLTYVLGTYILFHLTFLLYIKLSYVINISDVFQVWLPW